MKVGYYVRTENGINKVAGYRYEPEYENGHVVWFEKSDSGCRFTDKNLPKSSPNIIDLIEVGDYVNGELVTVIHKDYVYDEISLGTAIETANNFTATLNEDIKTIVTKEQFKQMEYKIGDKNEQI